MFLSHCPESLHILADLILEFPQPYHDVQEPVLEHLELFRLFLAQVEICLEVQELVLYLLVVEAGVVLVLLGLAIDCPVEDWGQQAFLLQAEG